jgi:hypothetical protein
LREWRKDKPTKPTNATRACGGLARPELCLLMFARTNLTKRSVSSGFVRLGFVSKHFLNPSSDDAMTFEDRSATWIARPQARIEEHEKQAEEPRFLGRVGTADCEA